MLLISENVNIWLMNDFDDESYKQWILQKMETKTYQQNCSYIDMPLYL